MKPELIINDNEPESTTSYADQGTSMYNSISYSTSVAWLVDFAIDNPLSNLEEARIMSLCIRPWNRGNSLLR